MSQDNQKEQQPGRISEAGATPPPSKPETVQDLLKSTVDTTPAPPPPPSKPASPPPAGTETFVPDVDRFHDDQGEPGIDTEDEKGWFSWKVPSLGWFVFGGILVCGIGMWISVAQFKANPVEEVNEEEVSDEIEDRAKKEYLILDAVNACVRGYLMADSIDEKLAYVRHPERVKPLMEEYYHDHTMVMEKFDAIGRFQALELGNLSFVVVQAELQDGRKDDLLLQRMSDGSFRVDWESDICYLPMAWDEFISSRPSKPLAMRVQVAPDTFYAYEFRDEERYECYKLTVLGADTVQFGIAQLNARARARRSDDHLFGYVTKGSEAAIRLRSFFQQAKHLGSKRAEPMILLLRFPEGGHSKKGVYIDRVMAPRWVYLHEHEEEVGE